MRVEYDGRRPTIAESAYVAPTAVIRGDVEIGEGAAVTSEPCAVLAQED